ncbi:MAG TPA: hypothetical protein VH206_15160 [Xanthobacteraceae bacterium]|jgi:hypothetical protein|nr:hypothetical protein [Xanthobacteraceae bacterium]
MSRLVRKPKLAEAVEAPQTNDFGGMIQTRARAATTISAAVPGDDYLTRMVKYIPAEIIGCSMLVNAILQQAMIAGGDNAAMAGFSVTTIAIGALIVGIILTPLFCWYVREDGDAWQINAIVSTIAFPFWAYLMGAVAFDKVHDGNFAAILILTFTGVSGLVAPVADKLAQAQEQKSATPKEVPRLVEGLKA